MDLIILVLLIVIIFFWFKDFTHFVYFLGITEIFFKVMEFIKNNIGIKEISNIIAKYIPNSIFSILAKYSDGLLYILLCWLLLICFVIFEVHLVKYFFKRK